MHNNFNDFIDANPVCTSNSKIASENGKRFEIESNESYTRIKIDGCLINSQVVEKCDFGFVRNSNDDFYFVELKGSDIEKALRQIISTINYFNNNFIIIPQNKRLGFIVSSKVPSGGTDVKKVKQIFAKHHGKILEVKNRVLPHKP